MSDTTSPNDDVVRWQQEEDLGHPLNRDRKSFPDQRSGKDPNGGLATARMAARRQTTNSRVVRPPRGR